jgi:hypothetical protein
MRTIKTGGLCLLCKLLSSLFAVSRGDRAGQRVVRGVSGQGLGGPTFRVGVECGVCMERCPFDVDILAKMREAVEVFEEQAA